MSWATRRGIQVAEESGGGGYDIIDAVFDSIYQLYQTDVTYEYALRKGYNSFGPDINLTIEHMDAWVEATGSYCAYAARGHYLAHKGSEARGTKFVDQTPRQNLEQMIEYYSYAFEDLLIALEMEPRLVSAWTTLVQICMSAPLPLSADDVYREAIKHDNRSYYLRAQYMRSLTPRWGGSHRAMTEFSREIVADVDLNPRIWSQVGASKADLADGFWAAKDYDRAIRLYSEALEYGDNLDWLKSRSSCYYWHNNVEASMADLERILVYTPRDPAIYVRLDKLRKTSGS